MEHSGIEGGKVTAQFWSHHMPKGICRVFGVWRNAVIGWLDSWEEQGLLGLYDRPRSGRPLLYTDQERQQLKAWVDQEPRQLKAALAKRYLSR